MVKDFLANHKNVIKTTDEVYSLLFELNKQNNIEFNFSKNIISFNEFKNTIKEMSKDKNRIKDILEEFYLHLNSTEIFNIIRDGVNRFFSIYLHISEEQSNTFIIIHDFTQRHFRNASVLLCLILIELTKDNPEYLV